MILSAQSIRRIPGIVAPFCERSEVRGMSYGLSAASYDIRCAQRVVLCTGEFKLVSSIEYFTVPNNILVVVHDKSTWARRGVVVQNTLFDPGWHGYPTLELTNHGSSVIIEEGDPIAQVVFHLLDENTDAPYSGKYQDQLFGPQSAKFDGAT